MRKIAFFDTISRWDESSVKKIHGLSGRSWLFDSFFSIISKMGDGEFFTILIFFIVFIDRPYGYRYFSSSFIGLCFQFGACTCIKMIVKRPRPFEKSHVGVNARVVPRDKYSFPSGHSAATMLVFVITSYYYPSWAWFFLSLSILICFSRIYNGVHYPSDVIVGALIGCLSGVLGIWLVRVGQGLNLSYPRIANSASYLLRSAGSFS